MRRNVVKKLELIARTLPESSKERRTLFAAAETFRQSLQALKQLQAKVERLSPMNMMRLIFILKKGYELGHKDAGAVNEIVNLYKKHKRRGY